MSERPIKKEAPILDTDFKAYLIKKGKKYMVGHGYSSLKGYRFTWTPIIELARKMEKGTANTLATQSGGRVLNHAIEKNKISIWI